MSPEAATFFPNADLEGDDFKTHINAVMTTLDTAVKHLDNLSALVPDLTKLGATHGLLGVQKSNFQVSIYRFNLFP